MFGKSSIGVRLRIDFGPLCSIGPGKIALLEQIERHESLSQAARELGMSYRRAWQLMNDLNHSFATPVVTASTGGSGGGGAELTSFGRELVRAFRDLEARVTSEAGNRFARLAARPRGATPATRRRLSRRVVKRNA
jgi:molybdate transport system regulatory protein